MAAFSPLLVYVSRYARHDVASLLATLWIVISTLRFAEKQDVWCVYTGILAFALSIANHELTYITIAVWLLSLVYVVFTNKDFARRLKSGLEQRRRHFWIGGLVALFVVATFYSSFWQSAAGLIRAIPDPTNAESSLGYWIAQHQVERGHQPVYYYLLTLTLYDLLPFLIGTISAMFGLFSRDASWRFVSIFTLATLVAYSLAGEKMPWLTIHPLLLLVLSSGFGIKNGLRSMGRRGALVAYSTVGVALLLTLGNAIRLSSADSSNPVEFALYVQPDPSVRKVAARILASDADCLYIDPGLGWPFAWYLRSMPLVTDPLLAIQEGDRCAMLLNPSSAATVTFGQNKNDELHLFSSVWAPPSGSPGLKALANYFLFRQTWSPLSHKFFVYRPATSHNSSDEVMRE